MDAGVQCGGAMLGHIGGVPGYTSYLLSNADRSKRFEMSATNGDVDASDPVAAEKFSEAVQKVVTVALCGNADAGIRSMIKLRELRLDRF